MRNYWNNSVALVHSGFWWLFGAAIIGGMNLGCVINAVVNGNVTLVTLVNLFFGVLYLTLIAWPQPEEEDENTSNTRI